MFIIESYGTAVLFCIITMLCWGSWANTQKRSAGNWRFELFYWDYVLGIVGLALLLALTLGSMGEGGRPFLADVRQADVANIGSALWGGVLFNAANILLVAAISIAGMSVAILAIVYGPLPAEGGRYTDRCQLCKNDSLSENRPFSAGSGPAETTHLERH